jgi:hypothetical protein
LIAAGGLLKNQSRSGEIHALKRGRASAPRNDSQTMAHFFTAHGDAVPLSRSEATSPIVG